MLNLEWDETFASAFGDVRRLSYADRYTTIPVMLRENVAEHSYWVGLYSLMVHRRLDEASGEPRPDLVGAVLSYAAAHDAAECVSGDIVRTFKYMTPELKAAIDAAEDLLVQKFPAPLREVMSLGCDLAGTPEGWKYVKGVVKCADFMSLYAYMNREVNRGNREIVPFVRRMVKDLSDEGARMASNPDRKLAMTAGLYGMMAERAYDLTEAKIL